MRKLIIAVAVFCLIAIRLAPLIMGKKIETSYQDYIAQLADIPLYKISIKDYDRGYRSSEVVLSIGVDQEMLGVMLESSELVIPEEMIDFLAEGFNFYMDIQHGPILTANGLGLGWTDMNMDIDRSHYPQWAGLFDQLELDSILDFKTRIGLSGNGWSTMNMPAFEVKEGDMDIVFSGVAAYTYIHNYFESYVQDMEMAEFSMNGLLENEPFVFTMKELYMHGHSTLRQPIWFSIGDYELGVSELAMTIADKADIQVDNLSLYAAILDEDDQETFTVKETIKFDSATVNDYQVKNGELSFAYLNLSKSAFNDYMTVAYTPEFLQGDETAMAEIMMPLAEDFLKKSPGLEFEKIAFESEDGYLDLSMSVKINSDLLTFPLSMQNPLPFILATEVDAETTLSKSLLKTIMVANTKSQLAEIDDAERPDEQQIEQQVSAQIDSMVPVMVQQGYIVDQGDTLSSKISFAKGAALVNGQPLALPF